jgi:hypothetical protein
MDLIAPTASFIITQHSKSLIITRYNIRASTHILHYIITPTKKEKKSEMSAIRFWCDPCNIEEPT